jgi:hypothetical protein
MMAYDINAIYDRTSGHCHICGRKVCFSNYGILGARGAWEIEHSRPQARGGTNHGNNLYAACIPCNREKSHRWSTRTVRAWNDRKRAPLSRIKRREAKQQQALAGAVLCGIAGSVFGPLGAIIGAAVGAAIGDKQNPDHR